MSQVIRVINFATSTSAATTTAAIDLDYRFGPTPVRSIFVQKSAAAGPSVFIEAAPVTTGPWIPFIEVTAACTATVIPFQVEYPFVRASYAGSGPLITVIGVV